VSKNTVFYLSNILQVVFRFAQMIVVTRALSSIDLGVYYAATAYPQLLSRFFDLGLTHAARYYILMLPEARQFVIRLLMIFTLVVFVPIFLIFFLFERFPLDTSEVITAVGNNYFILSVYCVLLIINSVLNSIVLSLERFKALLWTAILPYAFFIIIVIYKVSFLTLDVNDVLQQLLVSEVLLLAIYLVALMDLFKSDGRKTSLTVKEIFKYAMKIYPNSFLKPITTRLDRIILSFIATPTFIGHYSILMTLREVSILPVTTYGQMLMNKLSGLLKNNREQISKLMTNSLIVVFLIYTAGFGVYFLLKDFVLHLFFKEVTTDMYLTSYIILSSAIPLALFSLLTYYFLVMNNLPPISWAILASVVVFYLVIFLGFKNLDNNVFSLAVLVSTIFSFSFLVAAKLKKLRWHGVKSKIKLRGK